MSNQDEEPDPIGMATPDCLFDKVACRLHNRHACVQLTPKAASVLECLMSNQRQVISRERILQQVWGGIHVTPGLVREYIFDLRHALGDDAQHPKFIETVRGQGFRFMGGISFKTISESGNSTSKHTETRATLAVLRPDADASSKALAETMAGDLINELGRFRDIFVVSRTSSFAADQSEDARTLAHDVDADFIVESSFHQLDEQLRVRFSLIDGRTGRSVWSEKFRYSNQVDDCLPDLITETVVPMLSGWHGAVHIAMHKSVTFPDTEKLNFFEHYIRACDIEISLDETGLNRSIYHLRRSLELDPRFARCWAMKSVMLKWAYNVVRQPDDAMLVEAAAAIKRAHALEPHDPANLGLVALVWAAKGDMSRAEAAIRQAEVSAGSDKDACVAVATPLALVLADFNAAGTILDRALSPHRPVAGYFRLIEARIAFFIDDFERSISASRQGFRHVSGLAWRALSQTMLGEEDCTKETLAKIDAGFPQFDFDRFATTLPIIHKRASTKYDQALSRLNALR